MSFTLQELTAALAGHLAPHLPGVTFYDNPNQQGTQLPALFLQKTHARITGKTGPRFLRKLGLDLVYLVDFNRPDMQDQYMDAAEILDGHLELFPCQGALLRTYGRHWTVQEDALHYTFDLKLWVSRQEDAVLMGSIQAYREEVI